MIKIPFRRVTMLLLVLALFAGSAAGYMPVAASPVMDMVGLASSSDHGCGNCTPAKMTFADCGTICISPVAILLPTAAASAATAIPPCRWADEPMRCRTIEPATAPPRS